MFNCGKLSFNIKTPYLNIRYVQPGDDDHSSDINIKHTFIDNIDKGSRLYHQTKSLSWSNICKWAYKFKQLKYFKQQVHQVMRKT